MPEFAPVPVLENVDRARFDAEVRLAGRPVILKGLALDWPAVQAARTSSGALGDYLRRADAGRPVRVSISPKGQRRRFFYNDAMTGVTFDTLNGTLSQVAGLCLANQALDGREDAEAIYMQAVPVSEAAPAMTADLFMPLVDGVPPRLWIGNSLRTSTHFDYSSNIAVHVAGAKTFTLFPPDQAANLYPGPLDVTPAGVPISLVEFDAPDLVRYPNYRQALQTAQVARLAPGDALFIPPLWWHHVDTVGPLNMLVNYWWDEIKAPPIEPLTALYTAAVAIQNMPPAQRAAWRALFDYYVFRETGDPVGHLPDPLRGVFRDPPDPRALDRLGRSLNLRR